jgi:hypothetical protein
MSETSILPGAGNPTDAGIGAEPPDSDVEDTDGGSRRRLMILGAIAGVIVLAAVAYLLLHKSSPATVATPVPPTAVQSTAPKAHSGSKATHKGSPSTLPKVAKQAAVRDPFTPLVVAPIATGDAPASSTKVTNPTGTSTPPATTVTTTGGTNPVTVQPQPTASSTTTGNGHTAGSPQWIQLMKVHGQTATFDVGYAHHKFRRFIVSAPKADSAQGTVFDKIFALIGVQNGEATVQIGDATPFDLETGISHTV